MTKTRTTSPAAPKSLYDGASVALEPQSAPKSLYAKPPANGKPPKESKKAQKSQCGTCTHGREHHREETEVTYNPKNRLAGAGRCTYARGGFPCSCEVFLAGPAGAEKYQESPGYWLHPDDYAYVMRFRAEDDKRTRLSLSEILALMGPNSERYPMFFEGRAGKTPARGPRTAHPDAKLKKYSERPDSAEIRDAMMQSFAKPKLSSIRIGAALRMYRKLVFISNAIAMCNTTDDRTRTVHRLLEDPRTYSDDDCSVTTSRNEFERIRVEINSGLWSKPPQGDALPVS